MLIGKVFCEDGMPDDFRYNELTRGAVQLTRAGSAKLRKAVSAYEIVDVPALTAMYSSSVSRLHMTFLVLCAGSCDYSLSLQRFGYSEASMMSLLEGHATTGFRRCSFLRTMYKDSDPHVRGLVFDPGAFVAEVLAKGKRRLGKEDSIAELTSEIWSMLYVVRYFAG